MASYYEAIKRKVCGVFFKEIILIEILGEPFTRGVGGDFMFRNKVFLSTGG